MGFTRNFEIKKKDTLKSAKEYGWMEDDIKEGVVFPAVRNGRIDFYYNGGVLFQFEGNSFGGRNKNYDNYGGEDITDEYKRIKQQNDNKNTRKDKKQTTQQEALATERKLLNNLNRYTFGKEKSKVVVLDIEVNLTGPGGKKCDMVLLNTTTGQLMFVEGKVFNDKRVSMQKGRKRPPEVIEQIRAYTKDITEQNQDQNIVRQYAEHIRVINAIFGKDYEPPVRRIPTAKLLVYETPRPDDKSRPSFSIENSEYTIKLIESELPKGSVAWYFKGEEPSLEEIWNALTRCECK